MTAPTKYSRSEATRSAILAAARDVFAQAGFDRATIRAIARRARIDPALVIRYFGSKEALFASATQFDLKLPDLSGIAPDQVGRQLMAHFLDMWEGPQSNNSLRILLRTAASSDDAAARMRAIFASQVAPAIEAAAKPEEVGARSGLVASQLLGLALCRYILELPPVAAMTRDQLIALIAPTLQRYVTGAFKINPASAGEVI